MSDFDRYEGQNCRCGNDPMCNNCFSGQFYEEHLQREEHQEPVSPKYTAGFIVAYLRAWHPDEVSEEILRVIKEEAWRE